MNTLSEERSSFGSSSLFAGTDYKAKETSPILQKGLRIVRYFFFEIVLFDHVGVSTKFRPTYLLSDHKTLKDKSWSR